MAQIEQLLKYQTEDSKLLRIEREASSSEERKNYSQAKLWKQRRLKCPLY